MSQSFPKAPSWITYPRWAERYSQAAGWLVRNFHRYASWLVSISWWRFADSTSRRAEALRELAARTPPA